MIIKLISNWFQLKFVCVWYRPRLMMKRRLLVLLAWNHRRPKSTCYVPLSRVSAFASTKCACWCTKKLDMSFKRWSISFNFLSVFFSCQNFGFKEQNLSILDFILRFDLIFYQFCIHYLLNYQFYFFFQSGRRSDSEWLPNAAHCRSNTSDVRKAQIYRNSRPGCSSHGRN